MRTKPFEKTATFHRNAERCGNGADPCARCGKPVFEPAGYVHLVEGGGFVLHPDDEAEYTPDAGDLGLHPVGSTCARKLKGWVLPAFNDVDIA